MRKTINLLVTGAVIASSMGVSASAATLDQERLHEKHKEYFEESERREDFVEKERLEDFSEKERRYDVAEKKLEYFRELIDEYKEKINHDDEKSHYYGLRIKVLEHLIEVFSNILQ